MRFDLSIYTGVGVQWSNQDMLGMFFVSEDGAMERINSNVKVYYEEGEWKMDRNVKVGDESMRVYSYYPYDTLTTLHGMAVTANNGIDYMYGSCNYYVNALNKAVAVKMKPALSYVTVKIKKKNYPFDIKAESVSIQGKGQSIPVAGILDLTTGDISTTERGRYYNRMDAVIEEEYTADCQTQFSVIPMYIKNKTMTRKVEEVEANLTVVINNEPYTVELPQENTFWEQGTSSEVNIAFNGVYLEVESVSIIPWSELYIPPIIIQ